MKFVMLTLCALLFMALPSSLMGVHEVHAQKVYSITLNPIADAYISNEDPYTNFGGGDKLEVVREYKIKAFYYGYSPTALKNKYSYLMFDLKSIPEDSIMESAKLQLYGLFAYDTVIVGAHYCNSSDWNELKITWDNHPSFSTSATAIVDVGEGGWYSWDVTGDAKLSFQTTGKKLTEVLFPEHRGVGVWGVSFYSKDQTDESKLPYKPKLIITYTSKSYSVSVSISGLPSTLSTNVYVDGVKVDTLSGGSSKTFELERGSHTAKIDDSVSGSTGVRYYCPSNSWTFSSTGSKEFSYTTRYYLTVKSKYGSPKGEGWYDAGSTATISINSSIPTSDWFQSLGGKYVFDKWTGDLESTKASNSILMDETKTVTAIWRADYTMPYAILGLTIATPLTGVSIFFLMRKGILIKAKKVGGYGHAF